MKKFGSGMEKFGSGIDIPDPQHWSQTTVSNPNFGSQTNQCGRRRPPSCLDIDDNIAEGVVGSL